MDPATTDDIPVLPADVPVEMPQLPERLDVTDPAAFKAVGNPVRNRILDIILARPATASQIAAVLRMAPGTIGHHLQVLENVGMVQVVAKRLVHGIVAKYYTRTARLFVYQSLSKEDGVKDTDMSLNILKRAYDNLRDSLVERNGMTEEAETCGFPRVRISTGRAMEFRDRLEALINDFVSQDHDPSGQVYSLSVSFFRAPSYIQPDVALPDEPFANKEPEGGKFRRTHLT